MPYNRRNREVRRFVHRRRMEVRCSDVRRTMSESPHTAPKPRVDAASAGGDDRKGARRGAIFIGFVLIAYLVYLVVTGQFAEFVEAMSTVQGSWIVVASICMVFYIIFGVVAYAIAVWLDPESPVGIRDLISVEAAGTFFGNLTPMMVGGTPAQIYRLTKAGQPVGEAGATQFTRYIVFQVSLVLWAAILLAVRLPFFTSLYGDMTLLCLFSFGGHVVLLAGLFVISLCPRFVIRVAHWAIGLTERVGGANDRTRGWRTWIPRSTRSPSTSNMPRCIFRPWASPWSSPWRSSLACTWCRISCCAHSATMTLTSSPALQREPSSSCSPQPFRCRAVRAVPRVASRSSWGTSSALPPRRAIWSGASSRSSVLRSHARRSLACARLITRAFMLAGIALFTAGRVLAARRGPRGLRARLMPRKPALPPRPRHRRGRPVLPVAIVASASARPPAASRFRRVRSSAGSRSADCCAAKGFHLISG